MPGKHTHRASEGFERGRVSTNNEFYHFLDDLGEDVMVAAKKALKNGVDRIVADAKGRLTGSITGKNDRHAGRLAASIHAKSKKDGAYYSIVADAKDEAGFPYGQIVEFSPEIRKSGKQYTPHPFMYPAMDANREAVKDAIAAAIRRAVQAHRGGR